MFLFDLQRFAHKKGVGSSRNGRDSHAQRLGTKEPDGKIVPAGSILDQQRSKRFNPSRNVGMGSDHTLFAKVAGKVAFERRGRDLRQISIYPVEQAQ